MERQILLPPFVFFSFYLFDDDDEDDDDDDDDDDDCDDDYDNCFCGIVDQQMALNLNSSRGHCQR